MKLPYKTIIIVVSVALVGFLSMQFYWLYGLYESTKERTDHAIDRSIREADNRELLFRLTEMKKKMKRKTTWQHPNYCSYASKKYGTRLETSAIVYTEGDSVATLSTVRTKITHDSAPGIVEIDTGDIKPNNASVNLTLGKQPQISMAQLLGEMQYGIHYALHCLGSDVNLGRYHNLLDEELTKDNIDMPHYEELYDVTKHKIICSNLPKNANEKNLCMHKLIYDDSKDVLAYHIYIAPTNTLARNEMIGIFASSLLLTIFIFAAFGYLIYWLRHLKSINEMKDDFTHNITHELKTPIAVSYAANDALLNFSLTNDKERKYLTIIQEQLKHLTGMVEEILSLSMERRKNFALQYENIVLEPMIDDLIEQYKLKSDKNLEIIRKLDADSMTVRADRTHLYNMVSNLIDNAVKYSGNSVHVMIKAHNDNGKVKITVSDNGFGIENGQQQHLFEKFYRVPQGNRHDVKGYGLGLFYVKTMAEKHHGNVSVKSTVGKGSAFTIAIPE